MQGMPTRKIFKGKDPGAPDFYWVMVFVFKLNLPIVVKSLHCVDDLGINKNHELKVVFIYLN